ncbi:MutS family DNA mismatch repair protein [Geosporobacter ferrireducens]|uniref:DNA mismatch repair protein n=1 Tax=Geosporobacter ferrireducens TaxID=1424294 RepID=A0A1D8GIQ2_9FIRM|nr:MutS family DNA mismatch repair protein [Geosporobacter ferrireducens]AOT70779.1 DNA mismatch repair protein [Geosporobacter ferrireducens]MTI57269.1 DNA mismatch repair protein [Geosporobacter ferrireducens]
MKTAKETYKKRIEHYEKKSSKLLKEMNRVSHLRIFTAAAAVFSMIFLSKTAINYVTWGIGFLFFIIFIYLVYMHHRMKSVNRYLIMLKEVNETSMKRINGEWKEFPDKGDVFQEEDHDFSKDLDIFGQGSLYQWTSTANTCMGKAKLAEMLTSPCKDKVQIEERQAAIQELAQKRWWRQRLQAESMLKGEEAQDIEELLQWAENDHPLYSRTWVRIFLRLLPVVTTITLLLAFSTNLLARYIPLLLLAVHFFLLSYDVKKRTQELALIYRCKNSIKVYGKILSHFEKVHFESSYLGSLKERLMDSRGVTAVAQIKKLEGVVDQILNRNNMAFFPINLLVLWDYQCMLAVEDWKQQAGPMLRRYLEVIGEIEGLASLALIRYDYPQWVMPEITKTPSRLNAKTIGHPLLTNKQVCNDVAIDTPAKVLLITGSNMSGKSTLLRTLGINLVLAYAGAPVCAKIMECSMLQIYTCMRISDNLEKSISSFYGELLRIKRIVEASKKDGQVFFLLDEIFKGTNSHDRHMGAKMLIQQLHHNNAIGLVSTHDLELGELEKESGQIVKNYHFQEHYRDNQIYFDYKLRPGISTTRNALYLMKMAGVEFEDGEEVLAEKHAVNAKP